MKKLATLFAILMLSVMTLFAQAPKKFSYQAVVRNASNQLVTNTLVGIRISILQNSATGSVVYSETQMLSTNANGLVTLNIGEGTVVFGNLNNINWGAGTFFLKSEIDPNGGSNYSVTSTQQLLSVPYALYANEAGNSFSGDYNDLTNRPTIPQTVGELANDANYITLEQVPAQVNADWNATSGVAEILNKPTIPSVPTVVSAFTNDAGYITGYTETDPVFTSWDKSYNDLTDKPTIPTVPTVVSAFTNDAGYLTGYSETDPQFNAWDKNYNDLTNKPTLFSGNYNDLTNKPTIPAAANNAMLTIQRNNSTVGTFTADASSDKTVNISVPTTTSELTNNSGYITADQLNALLNAMNSRMDSLQTVLSAQNVEIASLSNTVDSLGAYADSLGNIVDQCGCGQEENACDVATVTDFDGNVYNTVGIGSQCWMAENLRTTHYSDGTEIPAGDRTSSTSPYYYDCSITDVPLAVRGYLYNWPAAMHGASSSSANPSGVQGICPAGWHLPSHAEWTQLIDYVGSQSQYVCDNNPANVAKALAGTTGWLNASINCAVGNDQSANNATGFGAYPAGNYLSGFCGYSSYYSDFWSTTEEADGDVFYCRLNRGAPDVTLSAYYKERGHSVRCIRNTGGDSDMSQQIIEMQEQMAELQARVDSLSDIVDQCDCGQQENACDVATVTDFDGNVYNTVGIGSQCWMAENLRATHYSDGTEIPAGDRTSSTSPYYYDCSITDVPLAVRGYLYNWPAAMHGASSSSANPSGVQGICPAGWHLPSHAEWTQLIDYVGSQSQYVCDNNPANVAKALAGTTGWLNASINCAVGNDQSANNATGFGAYPAGNYLSGFCGYSSYYSDFWSTTEEADGDVFYCRLNRGAPDVTLSAYYKERGHSVRCIRNTGGDSDMSQQIIEMQEQMAELQARVDSLSDIVDECGCLSTFRCGTSTISDYDGNAYSTIKLGGKCWMAENLRTTHYSNGDPIDLGTTTSTTTPYRYNPASDSTNVGTYGYLYNWVAVMNGAASSEANPSGVQGICPTGWHVPSNAEWMELETFVSSQDQYVCYYQNLPNIGKALASTTGWNNSTSTACGVGTTQSTNNATGFNARPAGNYYASGGNGFGYYANFWTTTNVTNSEAHSYNLSYTSPSLNHSNSNVTSGFSVRCIRN